MKTSFVLKKRGILLFYIWNFNGRISIINLHLLVYGDY